MLNIYDKEILNVQNLFLSENTTNFSPVTPWQQQEADQLILKSDMAMDLGCGESYGVSGILFTTDESLVPENCISLCGPDLQSYRNDFRDINYARFVIIRLKKETLENKDSQQLYGIFRKIDYVRYHIFLKGVSFRISAVQHREAVRVSKNAAEDGVSFTAVGSAFIKAYSELPEVEAVHIYFASGVEKQSIFKDLDKISRKSNDITESLNEIFKGLKMDCNTCAQKSLCDEIEGLKELHGKL